MIVATQVLESMRERAAADARRGQRCRQRRRRGRRRDHAGGRDRRSASIRSGAVETLARDHARRRASCRPERVAPRGRSERCSRHGRAICEAAVTLATTGQADAIVAVTREGKTARAAVVSAAARVDSRHHVGGDGGQRVWLFSGASRRWWRMDHDPVALARTLSRCAEVSPTAVVVFINVSLDLGRADANFLNVQRLGI